MREIVRIHMLNMPIFYIYLLKSMNIVNLKWFKVVTLAIEKDEHVRMVK